MEQSLQIKNLIPVLMEYGKIKIGRKGKLVRDKFRMPEKIDHFIVTTMDKDETDNYIVDESIMSKLENDKEIPVTLLYNDISLNFQSRFVCYRGMTRYCSGDGESAMRLTKDNRYEEIICPCERCEPTYPGEDSSGKGKCKKTGCLSVLIRGAEIVGGVWKYRTTGVNSVRAITASLLLIKDQTGGLLAGIPLSMIIRPKMTTNPIDGKPVKIHIVTLIYKGNPESLREIAYNIAEIEARHRLKIGSVEEDVRRMLLSAPDEAVIGEDEIEHVEEFHPEDAAVVGIEHEPEPQPEPELEHEKPKKRSQKKKAEPQPEHKKEIEPPEGVFISPSCEDEEHEMFTFD